MAEFTWAYQNGTSRGAGTVDGSEGSIQFIEGADKTLTGNTDLKYNSATKTLTVNGTIVANVMNIATTTKTEMEVAGSTNFGNDNNDEHLFQGTLKIQGALSSQGHMLPSADNSYDLGSPSYRWANIYTGDLHLRNERGDWTIIEEEDYLSVVNNKTGKVYKMVLEEIKD